MARRTLQESFNIVKDRIAQENSDLYDKSKENEKYFNEHERVLATDLNNQILEVLVEIEESTV